MSILIDELEARKNDYIVVADLINLMAEATNSTLYQVVDYLEAHYVNTHLSRFHIDDYYNFDAIEHWLCELGENDAKTTYFLKAEVMAFEPITKHGIFKESQATNIVVNDVYGRTYDFNQNKKNREDDYLTLGETLDFLNFNTDFNTSSYDLRKLRDLARKKLLTPCFYFSGYVGSFSFENTKNFYTEVITGYFTYRLLTEEICSYDDYITIPSCETGNEIRIYRILEKQTAEYVDNDNGVFLLEKKPQGFHDTEKAELKCIEADEIRFSKREIYSYIASLTNNNDSQDDASVQNDSELLAKLEKLQAENDDLNSRLNTARDTYKQHRDEIKAHTQKNKEAEVEKAELIEKLSKAELTDKPADSVTHSNTDIQNIKKAAIRQFNRSLATVLIELDYKDKLRKGDIANYIVPYMKELAFVLADEQQDKANNLTVTYDTLYDNHLKT
ncbi:hypothetical protein [Psychrobacter glacincola]|uniref:hypothetical protein n=1 Tax=Psychrobacter glacincola TaxID=56810 RepID=UPI001919F586|nr:hypothetical protein [Psychrobacter glacincola]